MLRSRAQKPRVPPWATPYRSPDIRRGTLFFWFQQLGLSERLGTSFVLVSVAVLAAGSGAAGDPHVDGDVEPHELRVPQGGGARLGLAELSGGGVGVLVLVLRKDFAHFFCRVDACVLAGLYCLCSCLVLCLSDACRFAVKYGRAWRTIGGGNLAEVVLRIVILRVVFH